MKHNGESNTAQSMHEQQGFHGCSRPLPWHQFPIQAFIGHWHGLGCQYSLGQCSRSGTIRLTAGNAQRHSCVQVKLLVLLKQSELMFSTNVF